MSPRGIFNKTHLLSQCPKSPKRHHHHQRRPYINSDKHQRSPILYYACPLRALVSRRYSSKQHHHHQVGSVYSVHVSTDQVSSTGHPLPSGDDVLCRWSPRGGELSDVIRWRRDRSVLVCVPSFVVCGQRASCERKAVSFVLSCRTHTSDSMCPCLIEYRSLAGNYGSYTNTPSRWPGNASLLSTLSMPWTVTRRTRLGVDEIMIALPGLQRLRLQTP